MKTLCILNGIDNDKYSDMEKSIESYIDTQDKVNIEYFKLRDMKIASCIGCFDCWVKTPGICRLKDEHAKALESFINADDVIFLSPVRTGYITSVLKRTMDRFIPSVLPYITLHEGESHHFQRYDSSKNYHTWIIEDEKTSEEEITFINDYFKRVCLNLFATLFSSNTIKSKGDIEHAFTNM